LTFMKTCLCLDKKRKVYKHSWVVWGVLNCRRDQWLIGPDADLKSRESSSGTVIP
jgi:hypothetical protein